ncbi:threonine/serine exporter family protein [Lactobacillus porci]|uniref:Threonine/serine exporter family protein n=1 Tax=Lactobacillus porci TaxID=2012477 RepID=A0A6A8MDQ3_9LACO|nr:threonine/serine exporter family protein [Lactobacillus porci]MST86799.1 threonine/serine exporter family protein [Lactobacillus porci]
MNETQAEYTQRVVHICLKAGRLMLAGGSEMYRVEDTMRRIAVNAEIREVNVFASPTGIFVSLDNGVASTVTELESVKKRAINLELVDRVNELSREFADKRISLKLLEEKLGQVEKQVPTFPLWLQVLGAALLSGTLMVIFLGKYAWADMLASCLVGGCGYLVNYRFSQHTNVRFLSEMVSAMVMGMIAIGINHLYPPCNINNILVGALMTLVPGMALTTALRDLFQGDLVSGIVRMCEAALTAIALGGGVGIVIKFLGA